MRIPLVFLAKPAAQGAQPACSENSAALTHLQPQSWPEGSKVIGDPSAAHVQLRAVHRIVRFTSSCPSVQRGDGVLVVATDIGLVLVGG